MFVGPDFDFSILMENVQSMIAHKGCRPRLLILDEVAIEGKIEVDLNTNQFIGSCCEHSSIAVPPHLVVSDEENKMLKPKIP